MSVLTESDVKKILRTVTGRSVFSSPSELVPVKPQAISFPSTLELVSGGLILERHARSLIEKAIFSDRDSSRTTLLELASFANLEVKKVEALLPPNDEPFWGRVGNFSVIRKKEYITLQEDLQRRMKDQVLIISVYCKEKTIDTQFFRKLLGESVRTSDTEWIGYDRDMVCTKAFYEECQSALRADLAQISTPIEISTLLPERQLPVTFISSLLKSMLKEDGNPPGALKGITYTPHSFVEARRDGFIKQLHRDGILGLETFRAEGLENHPGLHILEKHVVTEGYIAQLKISMEERFRTEGWAEVKDTHYPLSSGDENALRLMLRSRQGDYDIHAGRLVSRTLKQSLVEKGIDFAVQQAQLASKLKSKGDIRSKALKLQDLLQFLSESSSVPPPVLTSMLDTIYPIALDSFNGRIAIVQEEAAKNIRGIFWEKGYARFQIHYAALQGLEEGPLRSKLEADLVDYARELLIGHLDRYEAFMEPDVIPSSILDFRIALQQTANSTAKPEQILKNIDMGLQGVIMKLVVDSTSETISENQKKKFTSDLRAQLQKTNDASMALTLTLILLHAGLGPGVLKASGKYVPKLLKLLQSKIDQQTVDDLVRLKDAVLSGKKFTQEDFNRLRQIGDRSH